MVKPATTRTIGPIHFEDLDPNRFEDLVRQIAYDFKSWEQLEATGRAGSDDGFDARGWERLAIQSGASISDKDDDDELLQPEAEQRKWLIQCKREKTIGPKKLIGYLEDIPETERPSLYGLVLAAPCNFSKRSRDAFREKLREFGVSEIHIWGKSEIEDILFQPKNDHLLFAYFGISLQTRRRSMRTSARAKLATKRALAKKLNSDDPIVVRDATDDRFPYLDPDETKERVDRGRWGVWRVHDLNEEGLLVVFRRHFAFVSKDGLAWDFAETMNDARPSTHDDPWDGRDHQDDRRQNAMQIWQGFEEDEKGWYEVYRCIHYERILDVDDVQGFGDILDRQKQVYVDQFDPQFGPFSGHEWSSLTCLNQWRGDLPQPDPTQRKQMFPRNGNGNDIE